MKMQKLRAVARLIPSEIVQTAFFAAALAPFVAAWAMQWPALHKPLDYDGDAIFVWALTKTLASQAWYWHTPELGLPGVLAWVDFPMVYVGQLATLKVLTGVGLSPIVAINIYFFLGFTLTGGISTWILRRLGVGRPLAILGALAYALMPYHFLRMPHHLWLQAYFLVPICAAVILDVAAPQPGEPSKLLPLCGFCIAAATLNDIYYTFFFCYLLGTVAVARSLGERRLQPLPRVAAILFANFLGALLAYAPHLYFRWARIESQDALIRPSNDSETYGLKFVQMLLPPQEHTNSTLRKIAQAYRSSAPLVNENATVSLGLLLSAGLLISMGYWLVMACRQNSRMQSSDPTETRVQALGLLTLLAFLFGTVGGLGSAFAYAVMPLIRSSNRIVVFIAFFVVATVCLLAQRLWNTAESQKKSRGRRRGLITAYVCACILLLWDTHDTRWYPKAEGAAATAARDQAFFATMQSQLAPGTRIYQLPYVTFPEGGYQLMDYSQMTPYLYTQGLRYSFGAMRGTPADLWARQTAAMFDGTNWDSLPRRLRGAGFSSVLVNQRIPMGNGQALLAHLVRAFGPPQMHSADNVFLLFNIPRSG